MPGASAHNPYETITTGSNSVVPIHDADGNATSYPLPVAPAANSSLVWDAENRLVEISAADDNTIVANCAYDGNVSEYLDS